MFSRKDACSAVQGVPLLRVVAGIHDSVLTLQPPVKPIDPLVVPFRALNIAQRQVAKPEAPVAMVVRQP